MWFRLLGLDETVAVSRAELGFRHAWPIWLAGLLVCCAVVYVVYFYRKESLLTRWRRIVLCALRCVMLAVLLVMLFEPVLGLEILQKVRHCVLVLADASESMAIADERKGAEDIDAAAMALGRIPFSGKQPAGPADIREASTATRNRLAKAILNHPELKLFEGLAGRFNVRFFHFAEHAVSAEQPAGRVRLVLPALSAEGPATALGRAIEESVSRYAGQPIAGVVLLTDGAWNKGVDPVEVAADLKKLGIPLYPVGIGLPDPPDVSVQSIIVPETIFSFDRVQVRAQVRSTANYRGVKTQVAASIDGDQVDSFNVELAGATQFVQLNFIPKDRSGMVDLKVTAAPLVGETVRENNELSQPVKVINEKIKVLYVEGIPRWEYRYLRAVLQRDRRLDVKFLMTEGDPDLPKYSGEYVACFPEAAAEALKYDLIILGDVAADYFKPADQARIDELVRRRGGSLLMLAGRRRAPMTYYGTPIGDLLPVRIGRQGLEQIADDVYPVVTGEGYVSACMSLQQPAKVNNRLWSLVRPLYRVPYLDGAKQGATVLAELSDTARRDGKAYPLIAWHRVGSGKCMFVGTDQLWRLRFLLGDRHHARFWGQASQFLALSRLLGANKRIRIETDRNVYPGGEPVHVYANVLSDAFEPVDRTEYTVYVARRDTPAAPAPVALRAVEGSPGLFQGYVTPDKDGRYVVTPPVSDKPVANQAEFKVETVALERRQPAMQETTLKMLGEMSGGRYFSIRQLPDLPEALARPDRFTVVRMEKELWDLPGLFVLLILLAGAEWYLRRRSNLA